jgi:hypothetical protein
MKNKKGTDWDSFMFGFFVGFGVGAFMIGVMKR